MLEGQKPAVRKRTHGIKNGYIQSSYAWSRWNIETV